MKSFGDVWDMKFITDITTRDVNRWIAQQTTSARTINQRLKILSVMFQFLIKQDYIKENPVKNADKPRNNPVKISPFTIDEVNLILDNLDEFYKDYFTCAFFTGMRPEELIGLKVKYVDFKNDVIQVQEVLDVLGETHEPKTNSGIRDIPMFPIVKSALLKQCRGKKPNDYVFYNKTGKRPLWVQNLRTCVWTPILKKFELEHRPMYNTRHTFATLCIDAGESPGSVARWLGHRSLSQLYDTYYRFLERKKDGEGLRFMSKYFGDTEHNDTSNIVPILSHPPVEGDRMRKVV